MMEIRVDTQVLVLCPLLATTLRNMQTNQSLRGGTKNEVVIFLDM